MFHFCFRTQPLTINLRPFSHAVCILYYYYILVKEFRNLDTLLINDAKYDKKIKKRLSYKLLKALAWSIGGLIWSMDTVDM